MQVRWTGLAAAPCLRAFGGSSKDAVSVVLVPWPRASPLASSQSPPLTSAVTSRSDRSTRLAQSCAHTGLLPPCCGHRAPSCKGGPGALGSPAGSTTLRSALTSRVRRKTWKWRPKKVGLAQCSDSPARKGTAPPGRSGSWLSTQVWGLRNRLMSSSPLVRCKTASWFVIFYVCTLKD